MDKIHFYLPDFYYRDYMNLILYEMIQNYPDFFYENIEISAVYGCFPGSIWNGGRIALGNCKKENIISTIKDHNDKGIALRYTFTNPVLEEKHLYDTFCNLCMELGDNGKNEVLVNSPILEEYIRKNYPGYRMISSTTKCLELVIQVSEEAEKDFALVVLDNSFHNREKLFTLENKERYEIIVNSYCQDSCPRRREHYEAVGRAQLEFSDTDFEECPFINRDFYEIMNNRSFITVEDLYGKYYNAGFRHFKLDGRGFNLYKVAESYMYYFVKPEYRDMVRQSYLKMIERFR